MKTREQRIVFLSGRRVNLRPLRKSTDLEATLRWINDPEVRQYLQLSFPTTEAGEAKWFDELEDKSFTNVALAIETKEGTFIGVIGLHRIDWRNGSATTGTVIGERAYWGKGYGTDAKMILLKYAFEELRLHRIESKAYVFNRRSIAYSLRCGYRIEGRLRKAILRRGRHHDVVVLAVFRAQWERAYRVYCRGVAG